jgi:hypothetical protein
MVFPNLPPSPLLAYASAWLKVDYTAAFAAALLNNQPMGFLSPLDSGEGRPASPELKLDRKLTLGRWFSNWKTAFVRFFFVLRIAVVS